MKGLLHIEWLKIKKYRTFWVLAGLFVLLLPIWNYEVANGFIQMGGGRNSGKNIVSSFLDSAYKFPNVWSNMGFWGSIFINFLSILVIILTTNEFAFRTNRQNVIDGWSRMQFFHAKIGLITLLSLAATAYLFLLGVIFGGAFSGSLSDVFSEFHNVGYFFLLCMDYLGFAFIIALLIKRSGLAIGLFLLYSMIIENILKAVVNHSMDKPYGNLLPLQCSDELLPFPLMQMARSVIQMGSTLSNSTYAVTALIWCAVYYLAGRQILSRSDW